MYFGGSQLIITNTLQQMRITKELTFTVSNLVKETFERATFVSTINICPYNNQNQMVRLNSLSHQKTL